METIREAANNNEESISEWLVQAVEGERENTSPPENKKQGKETKKLLLQWITTLEHTSISWPATPYLHGFGTPQKEKGEKSNTEKWRKTTQLQKGGKKKKKKKRREKKRKKKK